MHTHSPNASSVPTTPHLTEDPVVRLAAELAEARAAYLAADEASDPVKFSQVEGRWHQLEHAVLRTKPTTPAGASAILECARALHEEQHCSTGEWRDPYEAATSEALANVAELLRSATWADYQSAGSDAGLVQAAAEAEKLMEDLRARDAAKRKVSERARSRILDKVNGLDDAVFAATPRTLAGAAAVLRRLLDPEIGMDGRDKPTDVPALQRVLDVLDGVAGAGNASGDAALFAIERELAEARKAQSAVDEGAEPKKYKALGDKITRLILKLLRTPASTPQGIIAKIMENADTLPPDGGKDATFESYMIFHVLRDLRRMAKCGAPVVADDAAFLAQARAADEFANYCNSTARLPEGEHARSIALENEAIETPAPSLRALAWKAQQLAGYVRNDDEGWGKMAAEAILRDVARLAPEVRSPILIDQYEQLAVLQAATVEPQARLLYAQYREAVALVAANEAVMYGEDREVDEKKLNKDAEPMYAMERRIAEAPGTSPEMLAVKLMAVYGDVRRQEQGLSDEKTDEGMLRLRALRDTAAAAVGLPVIDPEYPFNQACLPSAGFAQAAE